MKKIKITEKQAALLGLKKINEAEESGLKSSGVAMGELVVRVVISGEAVPANKDRILALIHRQDPNSRVGFFEATGKIVGNIKEIKRKAIERDIKMIDPTASVEKKAASAPNLKEGVKNLVKITKEQYNRIFASGLIKEDDSVKGGLARVDKSFKKETGSSDIKNLKPVTEEEGITADAGTKFNISKPNTSIPGAQKFGKPMNEAEGQFKNEIKELIKFLYRKSEELSPFWEQNGITYDDICDSLKTKGIIISKNGKYELSKKLGSPQAAIQAVEDQMSTLLPTQQGVEAEAYPSQDAPVTDAPMTDAPATDAPLTDAPSLETEGNYPAGAENDPNAPWNEKQQDATNPNTPTETKLTPVSYNREITLLKGPDGSLYVFYNDSVDKKEYMEYASVPRTYVGKDEDGQPEYDYDFDAAEIDGEVVGHYINDNLANLTKGEGVDDYEQGVNLVKIDEPLKQELLSLYDKDKNVAKLLGPIEEADFEGAMSSFKDNLKQASTPSDKPKIPQNQVVAKLAELKAKEEARRKAEQAAIDKQSAEADMTEMTSAASSGAFVAPMTASPVKRQTEVPVVGETLTTAGAGNFQYDANALPGIGRNGEFKGAKKSKAETTPQWAGGSFVKQPACSKLDNNKSAENGGCNQGASSLKTVKAKGSINAPSLGENEIFEAIAKKTGKTIDEVRQIINAKKSKA